MRTITFIVQSDTTHVDGTRYIGGYNRRGETVKFEVSQFDLGQVQFKTARVRVNEVGEPTRVAVS